jgi:hypothetical protein
MRKYGIKKYTLQKDGTMTGNNFEWTCFQILFKDQLRSYVDWIFILGECPKDLRV